MCAERSFNEEQLSMAVSAVRLSGMPIREAAAVYSIPYSTLRRRCILNNTSLQLKCGVKPALGSSTEKLLLLTIQYFNERCFGLSRQEVSNKNLVKLSSTFTFSSLNLIIFQVKGLAYEIDALQPEEDRVFSKLPSNMWYSRFSHRHNLSVRTAEGVSRDRLKMSTEEVRDEFFDKYEKIVKKFDLCANDIYNMDESGLRIVSRMPKVVCKKGLKRVIVSKTSERSETITVIGSGNASGSVILPPFVIFRGESIEEEILLGNFCYS